MVMTVVDLIGQRFGFLTVLRRAPQSLARVKTARWVCVCDCGTVVERQSQYLRKKSRVYARSCGCRHGNETHKMTDTRPHRTWVAMRHRCSDPKNKDYKNYGARGITVCARWQESFENFWADMAAGYSADLTLDRVDVNGPYTPENCRWATAKQQSNNRRSNVMLDTPKGRMTTAQAAQVYGLKPVTLYARLNRYKWPLMRALTEPTTS